MAGMIFIGPQKAFDTTDHANKLSIHFEEEKTKSILFGSKQRLKNSNDLDIRYDNIKVKQYSKVTCLRCILDNNLSGEPIATKVLRLINRKLKLPLQEVTVLKVHIHRNFW